jgi:hypothetical protein
MMQREGHGRKRARTLLNKSGYGHIGGHFAKGGHVKGHSDEKEDEALIKREVKKTALKHKLRDGGCAEGGSVKPRADRLARGGKAKGKHGKPHTQVNIAIGRSHPQPVPSPVPVPVPGGAPPGGPMAGPPPGAGPMPPPDGGMPPGGPPMGLKRGGRAKSVASDSGRDEKGGMPAGHFKKGGRAKGKYPVPMQFGGGGGKGRLEKIKDYGA